MQGANDRLMQHSYVIKPNRQLTRILLLKRVDPPS
jgi:hypothetical protein